MKKIIITYGIISGIITGGLMLATMPLFVNGTLDHNNGFLIGMTGIVIALSLVFFGVKAFRDNQEDRSITFGKGLLVGLGITMVACVFYVIAWEITYAQSGDWFIEQWRVGEIEKLKSEGASEQDLEKAATDWIYFAELYQNPVIRYGMTLMEIFPVGVLISLLSATLFRNKQFLPSNQ